MVKVTKTVVQAGARALSNRYTVEVPQDLVDDTWAELQQEIVREIDDEIMQKVILESKQWLSVGYPEAQSKTVAKWLRQNCQAEYWQGIRVCLFANQQDAVAFQLVWG